MCPCFTSPWLGHLEDWSPCFQHGHLVPGSEKQTALANHWAPLFESVWGYLKDWHRSSDMFCLTQKLLRVDHQWTLLRNTARQIKKTCHLGQKMTVETCNRPPTVREKEPRKSFFRTLGHSKASWCMGYLESHPCVQGNRHVEKKPVQILISSQAEP